MGFKSQFTTDMLTDAPDLGKDFYVANLGAKMTYTEAVTACHSAGHSIALLRYIHSIRPLAIEMMTAKNYIEDVLAKKYTLN